MNSDGQTHPQKRDRAKEEQRDEIQALYATYFAIHAPGGVRVQVARAHANRNRDRGDRWAHRYGDGGDAGANAYRRANATGAGL
jgi:hypothetical protein